MGYRTVDVNEYLKKIKEQYIKNPDLWYDSIIPQKKADDLKEQVNGDFSLLWHEHCGMCWRTIDAKTKKCYYDDATKEWLCDKCYSEMKN